jgi:cytochrome P450
MELAKNPEIQQKLRDELKAAGNLDYDSLQKLPYLDAVIKEGLRLHPASPQTERVCLTEDVIPLSKPVRGTDGTMMTSIRVKPGQVRTPFTVSHAILSGFNHSVIL